MEILESVPFALRGRGATQCVPIRCTCGEEMLWEFARGRTVKCPRCKSVHVFADDDAAFKPHNGQAL